MAKAAICKETIKKQTIANMKKLGTFKPEYEAVIDVYSELMEQYARLTQEFKKTNYNCKVTTANGGDKKAPIVATLESLRKDILQYSDRLRLNPKANMLPEKNKKGKSAMSPLAQALQSIET